MVACFLAFLLSGSAIAQGDTATFSDAATAELYARARVRHIRQDSLVKNYTARVGTRLDVTAGRSRFGRQTALFVHETVAQLSWQSPNDLKVDVLAARSAAPVLRMVARIAGESSGVDEDLRDEFRQEAFLDRPWFIPRALNDSVRLMGVPNRAALHPLADGAVHQYRFAITDSVRLQIPGRDVRAVKVRVEPKRLGPSVIAGDMWLDRETADVVRMVIVFLGEYLWEQPEGDTPADSADARNDNEWATRFVQAEADIEYALVESSYWLPYRQLLSLTLQIPWFVNATVPARAISTFTDYEVNTSRAPSFAVVLEDEHIPGSDPLAEDAPTRVRLRGHEHDPGDARDNSTADERYQRGYYRAGRWGGGRWEVAIPPANEIAAYRWPERLQVNLDDEEQERLRESIVQLAELAEDLPDQWVGRTRYGVAWEEFADVFRFNRVQGPSVGLGYQVRPGPDYTRLLATARFGISDRRPTAELTWQRDGPGGRFEIGASRTFRETEPWTRGLGIGNSLNGIFAGNDDADYYLALGGGVSYEWNTGFLRDVAIAASFERHTTVEVAAEAPVPDLFGSGVFQRNPPVLEGNYVAASLMRTTRVASVESRQGVAILAGNEVFGTRAWSQAKVPFGIFRRTGSLTLRAGLARGDSVPQLFYRIGGPQTVRGHTYGSRVGREFWSAQLDVALSGSQLWSPVLFVDAADTFSSDPLVGIGAGLSVLNGFMRLDISKGVRPSTDLRFDLMFRAPR